MKIEQGKYYRTRAGGMIGPMRLRAGCDGLEAYPFTDPSGETWTEAGMWGHPKGPHDLIAEIRPAAERTKPYPWEWDKHPLTREPLPESFARPASPVGELIGTALARSVEPGYEQLAEVLQTALDQSQRGKGKERHANDRKFDRQPIMEIGRMVGVGYPTGQASKKTQEAVGMFNRGEADRAVNELLGAIVYSAAAILLIREAQGN